MGWQPTVLCVRPAAVSSPQLIWARPPAHHCAPWVELRRDILHTFFCVAARQHDGLVFVNHHIVRQLRRQSSA